MRPLFQLPQSVPKIDDKRKAAEVRGTLERISFHNDETGFTVARLISESTSEPVVVAGRISSPIVGQLLICRGFWVRHPQFGLQLQISEYEVVRPITSSAIEKYLGAGGVKGVGPSTAKRIVAKFGERALDVIERSPDELLTVPGIGKKTIETIKSAWGDQGDIRSIMIFLQSHGVSPAYANKIYKTYQQRSIEIVERNPYQLASDIWGIGFKTADQIARNLGFGLDDPRRLEAGVYYVLTQSVDSSGHVFLFRDELIRESIRVLGPYAIERAVESLIQSGRLISDQTISSDNDAIYSPLLYAAETSLAKRILTLLKLPISAGSSVKLIEDTNSANPPLESLSDEQRQAVALSQTSRVLVITGGPGVGKTTTTNSIVKAFKERSKKVLLASPTGRAAKRLAELTGCEAATIHRLLAFDPVRGKFQRGPDMPLECDVLLVDEASMLDTLLADSLLKALPDTSQIIFVGDMDQLPSVGPGNVLKDLVNSGVVPVVRLTKIFRQAAQSMIIAGAHAINSGHLPVMASPREEGADFIFINTEDADSIPTKIVAICTRSLIKRGYKLADIQVIAPMQKGSAGSANLNDQLQLAINPPVEESKELRRGSKVFRPGDRVIQLRNNYDKIVYNGDIGHVVSVDSGEVSLRVAFDSREVVYDYAEIDELGLAYSLSIHKSQGSEFPVVVLSLHTQHYALLQRNLVYTAVTRARKLVVLVGSRRALSMAVSNNKQSARHTRLKERLMASNSMPNS